MTADNVKSIWWVERDPWSRLLQWHGDSTGFYRRLVMAVASSDGAVVIEPLEEFRAVAGFVFDAALKRALRQAQTVIITDDEKED